MKILLINDYSTATGGAELLLLSLREKLRKLGHDARCFSSSAQPLCAELHGDYRCLGTTSRFRTILQTVNPWAVHKLKKVLAEFQPDVVHVFLCLTQLSPFILPLLRDYPSLYYAVWYRSVCPVGTKRLPDGTACQVPVGTFCYRNHCLPLRDWLPLMLQMYWWRHWLGAFDLITAASDAVKQRLLEAGIQPIEVVWHGVPIRPQRSPLQSPPVIAFAARLVAEKGADVLLRAFALIVTKLPEAQLVLVGEGPQREKLKQLITELNLEANTVMPGHKPFLEMEALFSKAWVQVIPSLWAEPFGLITANAMMRGTAVVASAVGGSVDIIKHGETGFLVPPGDVKTLATVLMDILQNREFAEKLGNAGRKEALARLSEDIFVDKVLSLYDKLLRQKLK